MSTQKSSRSSPVDVLILGSGPAGLSAANSLARLLHTCIVFSGGLDTYRNALSSHMHNVLTWEHRNASEYRATARKDILAHYDTVQFQDSVVTSITTSAREDGSSLFTATDSEGQEWWGRKVLLATGVRDIMPAIPGYEDCWVKGIFHCLFCHGYEERGSKSAGVLAVDDLASPGAVLHVAPYANRLAEKVTIYTNGDEAASNSISEALAKLRPGSKTRRNISIESRKIVRLVKGDRRAEVEVHLDGGEVKVEGFLTHKPKSEANRKLAEQLGLEMTAEGDFKTSQPFGATNVPGVYAAGDSGMLMKAAVMAAASGGTAGVGIAKDLEVED